MFVVCVLLKVPWFCSSDTPVQAERSDWFGTLWPFHGEAWGVLRFFEKTGSMFCRIRRIHLRFGGVERISTGGVSESCKWRDGFGTQSFRPCKLLEALTCWQRFMFTQLTPIKLRHFLRKLSCLQTSSSHWYIRLWVWPEKLIPSWHFSNMFGQIKVCGVYFLRSSRLGRGCIFRGVQSRGAFGRVPLFKLRAEGKKRRSEAMGSLRRNIWVDWGFLWNVLATDGVIWRLEAKDGLLQGSWAFGRPAGPRATPTSETSRLSGFAFRQCDKVIKIQMDIYIYTYIILYYVMLCYVILYYIVLYYTILYYIILYYVMLCYVMLCYVILYYIILYYIILYYIILYYIILYYIIYIDCNLSTPQAVAVAMSFHMRVNV